ncbi:MAG: SGNH/GDSL hydrolase family protein [Pseudomonadota bacterium]
MATVTVIPPEKLLGNGEIAGGVFSWGDYAHHYLAEGDSWFSLSDILSPSFLYRFGSHVPLGQRTLIVNCAYPGDTLARMVDWSKNQHFPKLLHDKKFGWAWDGILLSAGGNDIIDAALEPAGILQSCAQPGSYRDFINPAAWDAFKYYLEQYFRYFVALRDSSEIIGNRSIPILYHSYGYPTPRNAPASIAGPWLYRAFTQKNIPESHWAALSDALMDDLAELLRDFRTTGTNLKLIDTLKYVALNRADATDNGDWLNEIHLNNSGKDKIARYWAQFL